MESSINMKMVEYEENVNLVAKINTELCKRFGLEHYLTEFSSNLIRALNQYKRFVMLMEDKNKYVDSIISFSNACISFFESNTDKITHEEMTKKMNKLIDSMNEINQIINNSYPQAVKDYLQN